MKRSRSVLFLGYGLTALLAVGCAIPKGDCVDGDAKSGYTVICLGDKIVDDTATPDTDTDADTDTDTDSDADSDTDTDTDSDTDTDTGVGPIDADGDGYTEDVDCDDSDPNVHPDATETCNGVDDNCLDGIDEGVVPTWYADSDSDGYGDAATTADACDAPVGYVSDGTDCDDTDVTVHPGAVESCTTPVDLNCDGSSGDSDVDLDGTRACEDCDDTNADAFPGNTETCDGEDNDCDTFVDNDAVDATTFYADVDGDSFGDSSNTDAACSAPAGYVSDSTDCDDGDSGIYPEALEICDGVDEDCDGVADNEAADASEYYRDRDSDGYGDVTDTTESCSEPAGYTADSTDCDDATSGTNPGASEVCDAIDNDCDGSVDEAGAGGESTYYRDSDGDGYGDPTVTTRSCSASAGYVSNSTDCDDTDSGAYPGAAEILSDGIDQDCDGADDTVLDSDGDGDPDSTDCDGSDPSAYTGATEVCDGVDNDCDGDIDVGATDAATWYRDADHDGYGDPTVTTLSCSEPSGYTASNTDCDDTNTDSYPGDIEWCDGVDNDCSGAVDDGDYDGDGYEVCDDCDDGDSSLNPGEVEICDGADNDCDGLVDNDATDAIVSYEDVDGDGYGDSASTDESCAVPSGYVEDDTDCDDARDWANPAVGSEPSCWTGVDQDCDGDMGFGDSDCSGAGAGANLFTSAGKWNFENPIGSGSVSGIVTVSGTAATSDCTTSSTDDCSAKLQGPGEWTVTTDTAATSGKMVYCYFSAHETAGPSVHIDSSVYRGTQVLASDSTHEAVSSWSPAVELTSSAAAPTTSGTLVLHLAVDSADAVWVDAIVCQQAP